MGSVEAQYTLSTDAVLKASEHYGELREAFFEVLEGDDLEAIKDAHAALKAQKIPAETAFGVLKAQERQLTQYIVGSSMISTLEGKMKPAEAVDKIMEQYDRMLDLLSIMK